jgi:hypothetical protein
VSVKRALLVAASALSLVVSGCGSGSAAPTCGPDSSWTDGVPAWQRAKADRVALALAERLTGRPVNVAGTLGFATGMSHQPIGVFVEARLVRPVYHFDGDLPWLLVDTTGTISPPYQLVRERGHARQLLELWIVVLAPTYRKAAVVSMTTRGGGAGNRLDPGYRDRRPPQPQPCAD